MNLRSWKQIGVEYNNKLQQIIDDKKYKKDFKAINYESKIETMYNEGKTYREIAKYFGVGDVKSKCSEINKICKLIKYRKLNRTKFCKVCGKEFCIFMNHRKNQKYCSKKCLTIAQTEQQKVRYLRRKNKRRRNNE